MTVNQQSADWERLQAAKDRYEQLNQQGMAAVNEARHKLAESDVHFEQADEAAFYADNSAAEAEKLLKNAGQRLHTLAAEEEDTRQAAQMANTLADDALSSQIAADADYSDLMYRALEALLTVSANAEADLTAKREAHQEAKLEYQRLTLESSMARLSSTLAQLRKAEAHAARVDADNQLAMRDLELKIHGLRRNTAHCLGSVLEIQRRLEREVPAHLLAVSEAERLREEATRRDSLLAALTSDLTAIGADIIPYEAEVSQLRDTESLLLSDYNAAMEQAERIRRQEVYAREQAEIRRQEAGQEKQRADGEFRQIQQDTAAAVAAAEARAQAARAEAAKARALAEQAQDAARAIAERLAPLEEKARQLTAAVNKARATAAEAARMVANAQAAKMTIKNDSLTVLASAESILQTTLDTANRMVAEKERALAKLQQEADELRRDNGDQQLALITVRAAEQAEANIAASEEECQQLTAEALGREEAARARLDMQLAMIRRQIEKAEREVLAAEKNTREQMAKAESIKQKLELASNRRLAAEKECQAVQQRINDINAQIEQEAINQTADLDQRIVSLWEQGEETQVSINNHIAEILRAYENCKKYRQEEAAALAELKTVLENSNIKLRMAQTHTATLLNQEMQARRALETLISTAAAADEISQRAALMLLEAAKRTESGVSGEGWRQEYRLEIEEQADLDYSLLDLPVNTVEGGETPLSALAARYAPAPAEESATEQAASMLPGIMDALLEMAAPPEQAAEPADEDAIHDIARLLERQWERLTRNEDEAEAAEPAQTGNAAAEGAEPDEDETQALVAEAAAEQGETQPLIAEAEPADQQGEEQPLIMDEDDRQAGFAAAQSDADADQLPVLPAAAEEETADEPGLLPDTEDEDMALVGILRRALSKMGVSLPPQPAPEAEPTAEEAAASADDAAIASGSAEAEAWADQPLITEAEYTPQAAPLIAEAEYAPATQTPPAAAARVYDDDAEEYAPLIADEDEPSAAEMPEYPQPGAAELEEDEIAPSSRFSSIKDAAQRKNREEAERVETLRDAARHEREISRSAQQSERLEEEISAMRQRLGREQREAAAAAGPSAELAALQREAERIARAEAEAEAVLVAEETARRAAEEQAAAAEAERLARLAGEMTAKLAAAKPGLAAPAPLPPLSRDGDDDEEDDDDIEAELRRLIFSDFNKR